MKWMNVYQLKWRMEYEVVGMQSAEVFPTWQLFSPKPKCTVRLGFPPSHSQLVMLALLWESTCMARQRLTRLSSGTVV